MHSVSERPISQNSVDVMCSAALQASLNEFMSLGKKDWEEVRKALTDILKADSSLLRDNKQLRGDLLVSMVRCTPNNLS